MLIFNRSIKNSTSFTAPGSSSSPSRYLPDPHASHMACFFFFWSGILWKTCGKDKSTRFFSAFFLLPHPFRRKRPEEGALVSDSADPALYVTSLAVTATTSSQFDWISFLLLHCVLVSLLHAFGHAVWRPTGGCGWQKKALSRSEIGPSVRFCAVTCSPSHWCLPVNFLLPLLFSQLHQKSFSDFFFL